MQATHEMIKFEGTLPINIYMHNVNLVQNHWHSEIEIIFILSGTVDLIYDGKKYVLNKNDIFLINSNKIHAITSNSENVVVAAQIEYDYIKEHYKNLDNIEFDCKSVDNQNIREFEFIRKILTNTIWIYNKGFDEYEIKINSLLLDLIYILINNFKVETDKKATDSNSKHLERLIRIKNYVKENFNDDISLSKVAEVEYITPQYLSRFFEKHMGINFSTYVNRIRLEYAVKELNNSKDSITDISFNSGFPNVKSFISFFKSNYNETPNNYRKRIKEINDSAISEKGEKTIGNYLNVYTTSYFKEILEYLKIEENTEISNEIDIKISKSIEIDLQNNIGEINNNWKKLITIGKAKEGLIDIVQSQIREVQKNIGYKYIRFHGIFDDEMMIYNENDNGEIEFNFHYVDRLFDFFTSVNLKPFIELSFMPRDLAKYKTKTIFYKKSITSPPKSYKKWAFLVNALVNHCIERYGIDEVKTWYFEVWNEPDIKAFWHGSEKDYYDLYEISYKVIKEIDEGLKVGGPSISSLTIKQTKWLDRYITYCIDNKCKPDFISFHTYPNEIFNIEEQFSHKNGLIIDPDVDYLSNIIHIVKNKLNDYKLEDIELHLTEWNSTISHRDLTNDTLYKGSYIFKNILENMDKLESFGYWSLSDYIEELELNKHIFHGGLGLITNNGIKKSAYYAFELLNKLGGTVIEKGDGYYITKDSKGYKVFLYNYCHFDKIYSRSDVSNIDIKNRYNVFSDKTINIELKLKNFDKFGNYKLDIFTLNKENGSGYDTWVDMGAPMYIDYKDIEYINNKSMPLKTKLYINIDKEYIIKEELKPHEIKVYSFIKSYI